MFSGSSVRQWLFYWVIMVNRAMLASVAAVLVGLVRIQPSKYLRYFVFPVRAIVVSVVQAQFSFSLHAPLPFIVISNGRQVARGTVDVANVRKVLVLSTELLLEP